MRGRRLPVVVVLAWLAAFTGPAPADGGVVSSDSIPGTTKLDAEGVENPETLRLLTALGCDVAQGFFVSRPLPYDELIRWLSNSAWSAKQRPSFSGRGGRGGSVVALHRPRPGLPG